jgi:hypothetical protein
MMLQNQIRKKLLGAEENFPLRKKISFGQSSE